MANPQPIILRDSTEAAQYKTNLSGWVSRNGHYWGEDEHMARYDGSTHTKCEKCGTVHSNHSYCSPCYKAAKEAKFDALPVEKWDGFTPLCLFDSDRYFFNDDVLDFIADLPEDAVLRIAKCKPHYLALVTDDNWQDDLPEDGELPEEVAQKLDELNAAIKAAGPVSWFEDKIAIDVDDLRSRVIRTARLAP
jgi:hypothetical protein